MSQKLPFKFNDGGREAAGFKGKTGDCVVRAIAIATEQPYQTVYDAINAASVGERTGMRKRGTSSARSGVYKNTYRKYLASLGWKFVPCMSIGSGCKVHLAAGELPSIPRMIVTVSRHLTAVIDGVINDTHDPQREIHSIESGPQTNRQWKPGETRNENGICSIRRRCVYGYFAKA